MTLTFHAAIRGFEIHCEIGSDTAVLPQFSASRCRCAPPEA